LVKSLVDDREKLAFMSAKAYECAITDATERAVKIIESVVKD